MTSEQFQYILFKVTKTRGFGGFNLAAKWKRKYRNQCSKETWFILTNLTSLSAATEAYAKRMGIEEMFRDFKKGGYNLESTRVSARRLISLILLICLSSVGATSKSESRLNQGNSPHAFEIIRTFMGRKTEQFLNHILKKCY
jgi:hypothetical protein